MDHSGEAISSLQGSDLRPGIDDTPRCFNRYNYIEASATLQPYLEWMMNIIQANPRNADNCPMIKLVTYLFGSLKDPKEGLRVNTKVESNHLEFKALNMGEGKIEEYRQFYPAFVKAVRKIDSAITATMPCSSEVRPVSQTSYILIKSLLNRLKPRRLSVDMKNCGGRASPCESVLLPNGPNRDLRSFLLQNSSPE